MKSEIYSVRMMKKHRFRLIIVLAYLIVIKLFFHYEYEAELSLHTIYFTDTYSAAFMWDEMVGPMCWVYKGNKFIIRYPTKLPLFIPDNLQIAFKQ